MYFESHAHYNEGCYDGDRQALLETLLPVAGIDYVVNIGACMRSSRESIALAEAYDYIYASVGIHPHEAAAMTDEDLDTLESFCGHEKVIAVGEIGLDYSRKGAPKALQIERFEQQLALAEKVGLPVIIHSRDAAEKTFDIIKRSNIRNGVVHCYSGSSEMALAYAEMGFYIGIGGVVTFHNAKQLVKAVEALPLEKILLETDCPYLAPVPFRGERNDSQKMSCICEKIAQIKQIENEEVAFVTLENGLKCFNIKNNC